MYLGEDIFVEIRLNPLGGLFSAFTSFAVKGGEDWILVDTGPAMTSMKLISELETKGVEPRSVFVTHVHVDHVGAAGTYSIANPKAVFYAHPRAVRHLLDPSRLWDVSKRYIGWLSLVYGVPKPLPKSRVIATSDNGRIGDNCLVLHTPGHASHHQSLYIEDLGLLFPGNSLGNYVRVESSTIYIPTLTPPLKLDEYLESVRRQESLGPKIIALPYQGVHEASEVFPTLEEQLPEWIKTAKKAFEKGYETDLEMLSYMVKESRSVSRAWEYAVRMDPMAERLILIVIEGLLEAAKEGQL